MIIKSVVTALPNHVMSVYRLPKATVKKLTSAVAQFWWSPGGGTKGMHWKSWDKLCVPKDDGGLGFKDLTDFNTAILGKQLWRLIEKPYTLFSRVFKGRYYRNASPLEPIRSYSPSYGWRSIISARSLVCKGLIKQVGTGSSISVWNDPWIPSTRPRPEKKTLITVTRISQWILSLIWNHKQGICKQLGLWWILMMPKLLKVFH